MRLIILLILVSIISVRSADVAAAFDTANRMYEQGKFQEAAANYEGLVRAGAKSPAVFFNLGNAWYKAGQLGRAIAAYRQAQRLAPRDPNVRFNLQFVRKQVTGSEQDPGPLWQQSLANLTVNEWALAAIAAYWTLFLLLAACEIRPSFRPVLRIWTVTAAAAFLFF